MKLILVPTDFSRASINATRYAAELAANIGAQLILLHINDTTSIVINPQVSGIVSDQIEQKTKQNLEKLKKEIQQLYGEDIIASTEFITGFTVEDIEASAKRNKVDMIVMGMQGRNYLNERFLGSTTTMLMHKVKIPILSIDRNVEYRPVKRIVLATDGLATNYHKVLQTLRKAVTAFKAEIYVLHVAPALVTTEEDEKTGFEKIHDELEGIPHSFHFHSSNHVVEDINSFVEEKNADMVVMIPRRHTIWDGILKESDTKRMAFHSKVPLLAIPE